MTRVNCRVVALMLLLGPAVARPLSAETLDERKVRCTSRQMRDLLEQGLRLSPTLASLVDRIERSDVIVYLKLGSTRPGTYGSTQLIGASVFARIVMVTIKSLAPSPDLLDRLGHELQHVVEIAEASDVRDAETLRALLRRIGWMPGADRWETDAAVAQGRRVRIESTRRTGLAAPRQAGGCP